MTVKYFGRLLWLVILIISAFVVLVSASNQSGSREQRLPKDGEKEHAYEPYVAVSTDLLKQQEPDYENFQGWEIADKIVYFQQRKIDEAIVQRDYILYHFDKQTKVLLDVKIHWREDLPEKLPKIISKEQAVAIVEGQVQYSELFYICPNSAVFPIEPNPLNPCWVVQTRINDRIDVVVIDAVKGRILGHGIPPPYTAFSCTGPQEENNETCSCSGAWEQWYANARNWFNTMGYDTEGAIWPTKQKLQSHIQSDSTAMFYELAHGGYESFGAGYDYNSCYMDWTTEHDIETWIADYEKMPFTFIGSCGGMCDTNDNTLSYEFRKGSNENTVTVGYCGMSEPTCSNFCWYADYTIPWQNTLFNYINQGWTVKAAFDEANASYPGCGNYGCMRFAGDENFGLVPTVERVLSEIQIAINAASDGDTIIMPPGVYYGKVNFRGKNLTLRSTDPNDPAVVADTVINGSGRGPAVSIAGGQDASCVLAGFTIINGSATYGGGIYCKASSPTITKCTIAANSAIESGGGIFCDNNSPAISYCTITGNLAARAGGIYDCDGPITNCNITDNSATKYSGGGLSECDGPITSCIITGNSTSNDKRTCGGGLYNCGSPVTNCTIAGNKAERGGGGLYNCSGPITNCIIWNNVAANDSQLYGSTEPTYSCIQDWTSGGLGNIYSDPCFVQPGYRDANGLWLDGDYHLKSQGWRWDAQHKLWATDSVTSRCIDAGNPGCPLGEELLAVPDDPNNEWGQNLRINMGAFGGTTEASMPPYDWCILADLTNDGKADFNDLAVFIDYWLNSGGYIPSDLDRSQSVDMLDFALLAQNWLKQTTWHQ